MKKYLLKKNSIFAEFFYNDKSYFKVLWWSNDISKVDKFGCKGQGSFYEWHPEIGYHEAFCDYWQEINWNER